MDAAHATAKALGVEPVVAMAAGPVVVARPGTFKMAALGFDVLRLIRVAIGTLALGELAKGQWRRLNPDEVAALDTRKRTTASR